MPIIIINKNFNLKLSFIEDLFTNKLLIKVHSIVHLVFEFFFEL
jgi:hypothetical protein